MEIADAGVVRDRLREIVAYLVPLLTETHIEAPVSACTDGQRREVWLEVLEALELVREQVDQLKHEAAHNAAGYGADHCQVAAAMGTTAAWVRDNWPGVSQLRSQQRHQQVWIAENYVKVLDIGLQLMQHRAMFADTGHGGSLEDFANGLAFVNSLPKAEQSDHARAVVDAGYVLARSAQSEVEPAATLLRKLSTITAEYAASGDLAVVSRHHV